MAILKVAEKWKLRFDYNAFLLHHQDARTRAPLHYAHVRKQIFLFPQNATVYQSKMCFEGQNECIGDERLHHPLSFAIFTSLTTYS